MGVGVLIFAFVAASVQAQDASVLVTFSVPQPLVLNDVRRVVPPDDQEVAIIAELIAGVLKGVYPFIDWSADTVRAVSQDAGAFARARLHVKLEETQSGGGIPWHMFLSFDVAPPGEALRPLNTEIRRCRRVMDLRWKDVPGGDSAVRALGPDDTDEAPIDWNVYRLRILVDIADRLAGKAVREYLTAVRLAEGDSVASRLDRETGNMCGQGASRAFREDLEADLISQIPISTNVVIDGEGRVQVPNFTGPTRTLTIGTGSRVLPYRVTRGAAGVHYEAFQVQLKYPVTNSGSESDLFLGQCGFRSRWMLVNGNGRRRSTAFKQTEIFGRAREPLDRGHLYIVRFLPGIPASSGGGAGAHVCAERGR